MHFLWLKLFLFLHGSLVQFVAHALPPPSHIPQSCLYPLNDRSNTTSLHLTRRAFKPTVNHLPPELVHNIVSRLNSIQDVAEFRRVCQIWGAVSTNQVFDFSQYSSLQDFFIQVLQEPTKRLVNALELIEQSPIMWDLYGVPLQIWLHVAAKLGRIHALETWFQGQKSRNLEQLKAMFSFDVGSIYKPVVYVFRAITEGKEPVVLWFIDKLQELGFYMDQRCIIAYAFAEHSVVLNLMRLAIGRQMRRVVSHPYVALALSRYYPFNPETSQFFTLLATHPSRNLFAQWYHALLSVEGGDRSSPKRLKDIMCFCRTCTRQDIRGMLHYVQTFTADMDNAYAIHDASAEKILGETLRCAIRISNFAVIPLLVQNYPRQKLAEMDVQTHLSKGMVHFTQTLISLDPELSDYLDPIMTPSVASVYHFITQSPGTFITRALPSPEDILQKYARDACGTEQHIQLMKAIVNKYETSLSMFSLARLLKRPTMPSAYVLTVDERLGTHSFIQCRYKDTFRFVQFLVTELGIKPTMDDVALALEMGRFDVLQLLFEQGRIQPDGTILWATSSDLLIKWRNLRESRMFGISFQEPKIIDYLVDKFKQQNPNGNSREFLQELLALSSYEDEDRLPLECYQRRIQQLLDKE